MLSLYIFLGRGCDSRATGCWESERVKSLHLSPSAFATTEAKRGDKMLGERAACWMLQSLGGLQVGADCLDHYSWAGSCAADAL
jgi:hypothetical protein